MINDKINILHTPYMAARHLLVLGLGFSLSLGAFADAYAQEPSTCAETCTARNESGRSLRSERTRLRATTVLPGQTAQDVARVRAKHAPENDKATPIKSWSEYEDAAEGLSALKKEPVAVTLHSGEHINGDINDYTEDAVLIVSDEGSLHIVEIREIRSIDAVPKPANPTLRLSEASAQSFEEQQRQIIRDKIRDYRLREAHQHVGRPMRIAGGTMLGVGAILEVWGLTALTTRNSANDRDVKGEPFGNALALPVAIAGAPLMATGIGLLLGANIKRHRAIQEARKKNITYSVAPHIGPDHIGAGATVKF